MEDDPVNKIDPSGKSVAETKISEIGHRLIGKLERFPAQYPPGFYDPHLNAALAHNLWRGQGINQFKTSFQKYFGYGGLFDYGRVKFEGVKRSGRNMVFVQDTISF